MNDKRYRVAQWGTGHSGMASLRALIEHPNFDLVGVRVYSDKKAGRDAGELCGLGPTGVIATKNIEDIIAAKPDCVVYMPVTYDIDDICRLLESGVNISTLLEHFHDPESLDPEVRQRIEAACRRGGTSLYSAGTEPGLRHRAPPDRADFTAASARPPDDRGVRRHLGSRLTGDALAIVWRRAGPRTRQRHRTEHGCPLTALRCASWRKRFRLPLDEVTATATVATARTPVHTAVGTFKAGTVAAWRIEISGIRAGKPLLQMIPTWYITADLEPAWNIPFPGQGWHVTVDG